MIPARFSLEEEHFKFLKDYKKYGFRDQSAGMRVVLERLKAGLEREQLERSAELFPE